ncbi:MAG: ribonuclease E/G [Hyphomonadaceae bacterium]|nr:ribonuclease E/G [Hyphomonadaceae bacterium]
MTTMTRWIDAAIGETREALVQDGAAIALRLHRWSDAGRHARWGEVYAARVTRVDRRRRGAFLDLGLRGADAFLPLDSGGQARRGAARIALGEGLAVMVRIVREAARGKSAVAALVDAPHPGPLGRVTRPEVDEAVDGARPADPETRARLDAAFEDALSRLAPIPGGGMLIIEPTAALVSIDVDSGARAGAPDPERFALELNLAALREAARQIRLRALGGVIAIDFVSMRHRASQSALDLAARDAFGADPWGVQLARLSRFGVLEASRGQLHTPLHECLREPDGRPTPETVALQMFRAIEREARAAGGRRIAAAVAPEVKAWLDLAEIPWRTALDDRIGPRWTIEAAAGAPRERIDVRAL